MADRDSHGIRKRLVEQWDGFLAELGRLKGAVVVRPRDGFGLFRPKGSSDGEAVGFELKPVVFNLPERADHGQRDLFVVIRGRVSFRREDFRNQRALLTHDFGSEIGYFRRTGKALTHVYGAHYDLATNELGHPAFHAQLGSFACFADHVRSLAAIN